MTQKFDRLNDTVEEMRGQIFELRQENDQLKKDIAACKKEETELVRIASEAKERSALADRKVNDLEQYTRRNNIRVFGIVEEGRETREKCENSVLSILHDKLGLRDITHQDIEAAHRVGDSVDGEGMSLGPDADEETVFDTAL
nr:hypothetical protein BaRGS_029117 [Batillaria attramentaria]